MNNEIIPNQEDFYALHFPSWEYWKSIKRARLWEAVALACNLDPYQFRFMGTEKLDNHFGRTTDQFKELLATAKANIGNPLLKPTSISNEGMEERQIDLSKFGAWVKSISIELPKEFPWQDDPMLPMTREWPWGTYETESLRNLALAVNRFWKNYNPTDPTSAPLQKDVIQWLKDQGEADRTAEIMAVIIRDDKLPHGRRN
jgi:hypothetical protein